MLKRIFTIAFSLVLLLSNTAFAESNNSSKTIVVNEYSLVKELKTLSDKELKDKGLTEQDIKKIKSADFSKYIAELAKLDENDLEAKGYNQKKIEIIKNFKGTEEEMIALAATLTLNTSIFASGASSSFSYVTFDISYNWSSMPFWTLTDYIGIAWSDGFYTDINNSYLTVTYRWNNGLSDDYESYSPIVEPGAGSKFSIGMGAFIEGVGCYAKSGSGKVKAYYPGLKRSMEYVVAYGHTIITTAGAGISMKGAPSISFKGMTYEQARKQGQWIN